MSAEQVIDLDYLHLTDKLPDRKQIYTAPALVDWVKIQNIPPSEGYRDMLGEQSVLLLGSLARIGWLQTTRDWRVVPPYVVHSDERLTLIEGRAEVKAKPAGARQAAEPITSPTNSFAIPKDTSVTFSRPSGPDGKCYYLFTPLK